MVTKKILVVDDEKTQATALASVLKETITGSEVFAVSSKKDIMDAIENRFYNLAVLDIRMDQYDFNGITLAKKIIEINPFAKILFVSRFIAEYWEQISDMMTNGKILGFSDKKDYNVWKEELKGIIDKYYLQLDSERSEVKKTLVQYYSDVRNDPDTTLKGARFEGFITLLFRCIGFQKIMKRMKDKSLNEVDLVVRNDIDDPLLSKFGKYILVECKNKSETKIDKNDFIIFYSKLENTNGLSELGFMFTTSSITRAAYLEALRTSSKKYKIVFIDNLLMGRLLLSRDLKEELKEIIDDHVKDN
jgi:CheY-like chemotaxis protein